MVHFTNRAGWCRSRCPLSYIDHTHIYGSLWVMRNFIRFVDLSFSLSLFLRARRVFWMKAHENNFSPWIYDGLPPQKEKIMLACWACTVECDIIHVLVLTYVCRNMLACWASIVVLAEANLAAHELDRVDGNAGTKIVGERSSQARSFPSASLDVRRSPLLTAGACWPTRPSSQLSRVAGFASRHKSESEGRAFLSSKHWRGKPEEL
jgi:hypothetical protein